MALQAQWSLDSTSNSVVSISRGLLHAATTDNVQPIAILACEKFGSIIAMCQETCRKIESSVLPTPSPAFVHFIQGTVGYSRGDCATHLGKSLAGVQFLGLAAALVTTMGEFEAANALLLMMRSTAADKTLHPTANQLKDLLSSLEKRLNRSGFANTVVGWSWIPCQTRGTTSYPSAEAIEKLVDAFRRLHRIGESTVTKVTVRVRFCAPWVIAFTTWCLGVPPSVYLEDGTPIIEQPSTKVAIIICADTAHAEDDQKDHGHEHLFVVTIHHSIGNPEKLIAAESHKPWAGMVSIEYYGRWILQEYNLDQGDARRALEQCLPYAAKEFLEQCIFVSSLAGFNSILADQEPIFRTRRQRDTSTLKEFQPVPFRGDPSVADILSRMLHTKTTVELTRLESGLRVTDLPLVKLHLESLKETCLCPLCCIPSNFIEQDYSRSCLKDAFLFGAAHFLSDALALSLFDSSEDLLVRIENSRGRHRNDFYRAVSEIFIPTGATDSLISPCEIESLLDWALMLVGHNVGMDVSALGWAMSCFKGQAVYPAIFDTYRVKKRGYLALYWLPGILEFQGEKYEIVKGYGDAQQAPTRGDHISSSEAVYRPLNSYPSYSLKWRVNVKEDFLELGVYLEGSSVEILRDPLMIISTLACSLVFERCPHNRDVKLQSADLFCAYTSPLYPGNHHGNKTSVVAVDGADHLRFYSLGGVGGSRDIDGVSRDTVPMVMRIDACLECCLAVCRRADCRILVL